MVSRQNEKKSMIQVTLYLQSYQIKWMPQLKMTKDWKTKWQQVHKKH